MTKYTLLIALSLITTTGAAYELKVAPVPEPTKKVQSPSVSAPAPAPLTTHDEKYAKEYTQYAYSLGTIVELQYQCGSPDVSKKRFQGYLKELTDHLSSQNLGFSSYQFKQDLQEGARVYQKTFTGFDDSRKITVCKQFIETIDATVTSFEKSLAKQKDSILPPYTH